MHRCQHCGLLCHAPVSHRYVGACIKMRRLLGLPLGGVSLVVAASELEARRQEYFWRRSRPSLRNRKWCSMRPPGDDSATHIRHPSAPSGLQLIVTQLARLGVQHDRALAEAESCASLSKGGWGQGVCARGPTTLAGASAQRLGKVGIPECHLRTENVTCRLSPDMSVSPCYTRTFAPTGGAPS